MGLENDYTQALSELKTTELDGNFFGDNPDEDFGLEENVPVTTPVTTPVTSEEFFSQKDFEPQPDITSPGEGKLSKVGKDIVRGGIELPQAVIKGVTEAGNEMINIADTLGFNLVKALTPKKLEKHLPDPNANKDLVLKLFDDTILTPELESTTGELISTLSQFMTGMALLPVAKGGKIAKAGFNIGKAAVADMITFSQNEDRLSDMLNQIVPDGSIAKKVTKWMAGDEDDSFLEAKLKQGLEGIVLEGGIQLIGKAAKMFKAVKDAIPSQVAKVVPTIEQTLEAGVDKKVFSVIGDIESPDLIIKRKLETAAGEVKVPGEVLPEDEIVINFTKIDSPDNVKNAMQEFANVNSSAIKKEISGVVTDKKAIKQALKQGTTRTIKDISEAEVIVRKSLKDFTVDEKLISKVLKTIEAGDIISEGLIKTSIRSAAKAGTKKGISNKELEKIFKKVTKEFSKSSQLKEDPFTTLLMRKSGQPLNKEQTIGARMFYNTTTEKLMETAELAAKFPEDTAAQYNFRKMLTVHHAVQKELMGARAEAGRALQAWNVQLGVPKEMRNQVDAIVAQSGGNDVSSALAQSLLQVRENPEAISVIVNGGWKTRALDAVIELRTFGLLTSGRTHVRNTISNATMSLNAVSDRFLASATNPEAVSRKEAYVFSRSLVNATSDGWKAAREGFKTGTLTGKAETGFIRRSSAEVLDPNSKLPQLIRSGIDAYSSGIAKLSVNSLSAMDGFFNTILFKAEKGALLTRKGLDLGLKGKDLDDFITVGFTQADDAIDASARQYALVNTFNNSLTGWERDLQNLLGKNKAVRFIVPFVRTPINVFNMALKSTPLAPLYKSYRDDIAAGGARKALAKARVSTGTSQLWISASLASDGYITGAGPQDRSIKQAWMRKGWRPNSILVNGKYYSYQGMEPLSTLLGLGATMSEGLLAYDMYGMGEDEQQSVGDLMAALPIALSQEIFNKHYLTGLSDVLKVLDPAFSGDVTGQMNRIRNNMINSVFVPNIAKDARRAFDDTKRYSFGLVNKFKDSALGISKELAPKRDMWGDKLKYREGNKISEAMMQFVNPFIISAVNENPIDEEIIRLNAGITRPGFKQSFTRGGHSAKVDLKEIPEVYSRFLELSGNGLKMEEFGGMGTKDYLNALVSGNADESETYFELPDEFKEKFLKQIVDVYKSMSKIQIYDEFPQLRNKVNKGVQKNFNEIQEMLK